jgi:hypothetical protein
MIRGLTGLGQHNEDHNRDLWRSEMLYTEVGFYSVIGLCARVSCVYRAYRYKYQVLVGLYSAQGEQVQVPVC